MKVRAIMCFGHGPQLDVLLSNLLGCPAPITELRKAGAACVEMESLAPAPQGRLARLFTPKALRLLGRRAAGADRKRRAG
jgi:phosphohistidine phosphatase SixA